MRITVKHLLMMCIPSLAIACTPKEPVKDLALSFDDGPNIIESTWFSISAFSGKDITNLEAIPAELLSTSSVDSSATGMSMRTPARLRERFLGFLFPAGA